MKRSKIRIIAIAILSIVASACGATSPAQQSTGSNGTFPAHISSGNGEVTIPRRPLRILSLSPSATQMVYAVGAGKQVVGVDKYSTYPTSAPRTAFTGSETSAEPYLRYRPDLVLLAYDTGHVVEQLKALHIPTLLLPAATSISQAEQQISELGKATGHPTQARKEIDSINSSLAATVARVGTRARGKSYYVEIDPTLYAPTSNTFIGALFRRFGMTDIADAASGASSGYPQLSAEYLLRANPDYVYLADSICCHATVSSFASRPGFASIQAVRSHRIYVVNDSIASQWGPHSLEVFANDIAHSILSSTHSR